MARHVLDAAWSVRPISITVDGGRIKFKGSATLIQQRESILLVTAEHVLKGEKYAKVGIPNDLPVSVSADIGALRSRYAGVDDPDIAIVGIGRESRLRCADTTLLEYQRSICLDNPFLPKQYLAGGIPASRTKLRVAHDNLQTEMMFGAFEAKKPDWYSENSVDPETHIAVTYQRDAVITPAGDAAVGADPHGMSGGPLLVVGEAQGKRRLYPVGILTEYRETQEFALIGVRLHIVIDCLVLGNASAQTRFLVTAATA